MDASGDITLQSVDMRGRGRGSLTMGGGGGGGDRIQPSHARD